MTGEFKTTLRDQKQTPKLRPMILGGEILMPFVLYLSLSAGIGWLAMLTGVTILIGMILLVLIR